SAGHGATLMESQKRPATRISAANSEKEAEGILSQFTTADQARQAGADLCARYSLSPRHDVLVTLAVLLPASASPPSAEQMLAFLATQHEGLKSAGREDHVRLLLKVTAAAPETGLDAAANLLLEMLRTSGEADPSRLPELDEDAIGRVLTMVPGLASAIPVTLSLAISNGDATSDWLARWYRFLLPFLGLEKNASSRQLHPQQARSLLDSLGTLDEAVVPTDLLFACPRVMTLAGDGGADGFCQTRIGVRLLGLVPAVGSITRSSGQTVEAREAAHIKSQ